MTGRGASAAPAGPRGPSRRIAVATGFALWLLYAATVPPGLLPWDAAEFTTAFVTFGVPHPPGTPLVVTFGRAVVALLAPVVDAPVAAALASATAAAVAGAGLAWLLMRRGHSPTAAAAMTLVVGAGATWWTAATEPEAYAPALGLVALLLVAANEAAWHDTRAPATAWRWRLVALYAAALAPAVHQLVWVAVPAALWLGWPRRPAAVPWPRLAVALPIVLAVAGSVWGVLLVRGRLGAPVLMGDPTTLDGLRAIATRAAYGSPGWWPRQAAPGWQALMPLQYLHEQYAVGRAAWPFVVSVGVVAPLAVWGGRRWWREDRRWAVTVLLLLGAGTLGVAWHLNLKLGPSLGWGVVPVATPREVRERDTFFAVGLLAWGLLVGRGLVAAADRRAGRGGPTLLLAGVVVALLAMVPGRRAARAREVARFGAGLESLARAPAGSVIWAGTDWEAFGLWYTQAARGERRDLLPVIAGLVHEPGYRARLAALAPGLPPGRGASEAEAWGHVEAWARAAGRPLVRGPWSAPPPGARDDAPAATPVPGPARE